MMKSTKQKSKQFEFNKQSKDLADAEIAKYPDDQKQSAVMAVLTIAQNQNDNFLTKEVIEYVASYLDMPIIKVIEVATFYSMYNLKPVGKYHVQVCSNVVCHVKGVNNLLKEISNLTGINVGETTKDNLITVSKVECLGACANAPIIQINDKYYEDVNEESLRDIINQLKENKMPKVKNTVKAPLHLIPNNKNINAKSDKTETSKGNL